REAIGSNSGEDPRPAPLAPAAWCERWSASDGDLVADIENAGGHPGGADGRVVFGPGADVTGQGHGVPAGIDEHVSVVGDERVAVQRVLHPDGDSYRVS